MLEVIHYEKADKNKIIGFVDIKINFTISNIPSTLICRRISHVQHNDNRWFNLSSFPRDDDTGNTSYLPHWEFENKAFTNQLLKILNEKVKSYCKEHGIDLNEETEQKEEKLLFSSTDQEEDLPF